MPRARDLRPEFFTDEKVGELPYGTRLLFAGLWCHADLRGVFELSPRQLRVLIFPFDEGLSSATVQEWLQDLESRKMIGKFELDGHSWGFIKNWLRHQNIADREVEIWTARPEPPGWVQPERWETVIENAIQKKRFRGSGNYSRNCSGNCSQNTTPSPSPAPDPSPSPSSSPGVARPRAEKRPTTTDLNRKVTADREAIHGAIEDADVPALATAMGAQPGHDSEWIGQTVDMQIGAIFLILAWRIQCDDTIRLPSGFANAKKLWGAMSSSKRIQFQDTLERWYGLVHREKPEIPV